MPLASSPAVNRYNRRVAVFMGAYLVLLFGANVVLEHLAPGPIVGDLLALLPALPILAVFWAIGRLLVEERDEYQRDRFVRQVLWATAATLSATTIWGFLEDIGGLPHFNPFFTSVLWFAALGIGAFVRRVVER